MKKADLKKAIKPLVKECIQEVLLEEGLLSNIVSEVANGLQSTNVVVETKQTPPQQTSNINKHQQIKLNEHKKKMLEAIGKDAYNGVDLFEGTTPAPGPQEAKAGSVDLGSSTDSGVDISTLMGGASKIWNAMK
tara:strand:- start:138 stop:539 length:402 start_codon:yes stop_codon:yes gene_type:complete